MSVPNISVLISGSGSNLQALIDAEASGVLKGHITQVISSLADAYGLTRASKALIATKVHALKPYYKGTTKDDKEERSLRREKFNSDLANLLIYGSVSGELVEGYEAPELVVCAGWMLILSPSILNALKDAGIIIINLHPALPGAFEGTHAIDRAWQAGQDGKIKTGGVMIHYVIAEVDQGEPLVVKEIELLKEDTLEQYEDKVHKVEHIAIVEGSNIVLRNLAKDNRKDTTDQITEKLNNVKLETKV
ncbi:uncharacterized protein KQ657_002678 [Scheffersomyces spartinae]|uniref:Phosphoribosylglycinamide formyltransferase n=1 Tax=Scheffersomyces spartinae TaxID=45513 RepID=A0A9P8AGM0_9ASCO|nr:uncharacterized protein KQ657_002678 [Scheffersomyces spartinae]KAG7191889.1 hypothetical protein KQ657_002678 [Scheffersomyces spartinae]